MPFKSEKQRRWMWENKPELAREWTERYGSKPVKHDDIKVKHEKEVKKHKK